MMICDIQHLTKQFGGDDILTDVSLFIEHQDRIGLIGRNGSGKTTLLRLIARLDSEDSGTIYQKSGLSIGYLAQLPVFDNVMTGRDVLWTAFATLVDLQRSLQQIERDMATKTDQIDQLLERYTQETEAFERQGGYLLDSKIDRMINGLQLHALLDRPFEQLSGGEQTKICLGRMLLTEPELLILDEPTNHLDLDAVEWLESFLADYAGAVLIVSHDRVFLDAVVTRIAELEEGQIQLYQGNYTFYVKEKERLLLEQFHAYQEQQKKIKQMKEAIRRLRQWANEASPPSEKLFRKAKSMERALARIERIKRPRLDAETPDLAFAAHGKTSRMVYRVEDVSIAFSKQPLFHSLNFEISAKDRIAIVGANGSGKSTLLHLLLGHLEPTSGLITRGPSVKIGYLSQRVDFPPGERLIDVFRTTVDLDEGTARQRLAQFLFFGPRVFLPVEALSGGERMRLMLAVLVHSDLNVLILDEPTNHLDIESRDALEEALESFDGTLIAVSHDRYFLNRLFTKTLWLDQTMELFPGPYVYASTKRQTQSPDAKIPKNVVSAKKRPSPSIPVQTTRQVEETIERLEQELKMLDRQLAETTDYEETVKLFSIREELVQQLDAQYEQFLASE
ncbi:ABC-F family ATP-binding cassette domain-containing protein [Exiguobacterium sp. Helios]|uniref:ribosomal protection-like ABC-F family protein n=1 Tax=Exiguobacterium sp. Helios TaxID=2735868 RepID=UPI00165E398B|nr:ABC-F family ATP-binding cassette domain-containing protein [Exiguobacterium sp. Helios]QNR20545.1 ABC-F family ATP-binding cassette domain-containing protein [Exiguobacterium sp. Helios]